MSVITCPECAGKGEVFDHCDPGHGGVDINKVCPRCDGKSTIPDTEADNVVRLVPKTENAKREHLNQIMVNLLEVTLAQAKAGELDILIITGRQSNGGVVIRTSRPLDEVQAVGLCHTAAAFFTSRMRSI